MLADSHHKPTLARSCNRYVGHSHKIFAGPITTSIRAFSQDPFLLVRPRIGTTLKGVGIA